MKKIKHNLIEKFAFLICLSTLVCALCGCGSQELPSAKITRDDARTGGSLSFVYDDSQKIIYIGGEDEIVQYSTADESRNLDAGCRVGLKVTAPDEALDLSTSSLEINSTRFAMGSFLESVNDQKQRFFNIYPIVSKDDPQVKFVVVWQEGTEAQEYKIQIVSGTRFMDADGNVE